MASIPTTIAINGFGRIGRLAARAAFETGRTDVRLVAVNSPAPLSTLRHLLRYDSVHGPCPFAVEGADNALIMNGQRVALSHGRDPAALDWAGVDVVLECTGAFNTRDGAAGHLTAGAKRVLISAPAKGEDFTCVFGVNDANLKAEHKVVSNASCTTNCLAPVAKVVHEAFGITSGFMTTIHAYTGDQNLVDATHKDLHRARAAGMNMVPTSTGAARALGQVLPALAGRLDGVAIRVPTPCVSLVDVKFVLQTPATAERINAVFSEAADGPMRGVLGVTDEPLVSGDFTHSPLSAVVSLPGTTVVGGTLARVAAWYDNEWAFACRMLDVAARMGRLS
jgi:glyceraldehyde 3-phosphate dehydrogenase